MAFHALAALRDVQSPDALPYTSPSLVVILVLASYLLFLSLFYHAFQRLFSAGILGPLVLGAIYAKPLANILPADVQSATLSLGYLGLMLLIVQGGVEARLDILSNPRNMLIALLVGLTGIGLPIGLSMALLPPGFGFGALESFAVGAALASTSLGTTFAVLSTFTMPSVPPVETLGTLQDTAMDVPQAARGITNTRVGTILVGAALLDDIVGLVITSVIATLGSTTTAGAGMSSIAPWTIARPMVSSFLLIVVSCILTRFVLKPVARRWVLPALARFTATSTVASTTQRSTLRSRTQQPIAKLKKDDGLLQFLSTLLLSFTVLAFSVIADEIGSSLLIGCFCAGGMVKYMYQLWEHQQHSSSDSSARHFDPDYTLSSTTLAVVQNSVLVPFFFSSIGSAIPVKSMFDGKTVWRGVIFAGIMAFAKVAAGSWIFAADYIERRAATRTHINAQAPIEMMPHATAPNDVTSTDTPVKADVTAEQNKVAWPSVLFLGLGLVSRGEIGFLIINIARQGALVSEQAFNVAIWAITLNTLAGPMSIGILMRTERGRSLLNPTYSRWA